MVESERRSEEMKETNPMRFLLGIAIATVIAATVWSSIPTVAKQHNSVSIDPPA